MVRALILTATALAIPLAIAVAADPPANSPAETAPSDRAAEHRETVVAMLLDRINKLEERVAELEAQRRPPRLSVPLPPEMDLVPEGDAVPEGSVPESWKRFKFNGQWYHLVPTAEAAAASSDEGVPR